MYFLSTNKAINELQSNLIDDRETLKYLFGLGVVSSFGLPIFYTSGNETVDGLFDFLIVIISLLALFFLLRKCYALNAGADNKKFLNCFLVLNFIISLRMLIIYIIGVLILNIFHVTMTVISARTHSPQELAYAMISPMMVMYRIVYPLFDILLIALWFFFLKKAFSQMADRINLQQDDTG